jgi:tetratricopeptide (TPR) repeat protein
MTTTLVEERIAAGYEARREGGLEEAKAAFAGAMELCRETKDWSGLARALMGMGQIERDMGNDSAALPYYEEAVVLHRRPGTAPRRALRLAHAVRHLADLLRKLGRMVEADGYYAEALGIYRGEEKTPPLDLANALCGHALLKAELGQREAALGLWREAGKLYREMDVFPGVAESERQIAALSGQA